MATYRNITLYILLFICGVGTSFQRPQLEQVYTSQLGVVEKPRGSNSGPEIKSYLRSTRLDIPAPWCAAFVRWCLDSAGRKSTISAYSPTAHNKSSLVYHKLRWYKEMQPGDVFTIYYPSLKRIAHTGFAHRRINASVVETVEGNTNDGGSRDGYGVFKRRRPLRTLYSISRW